MRVKYKVYKLHQRCIFNKNKHMNSPVWHIFDHHEFAKNLFCPLSNHNFLHWFFYVNTVLSMNFNVSTISKCLGHTTLCWNLRPVFLFFFFFHLICNNSSLADNHSEKKEQLLQIRTSQLIFHVKTRRVAAIFASQAKAQQWSERLVS